MALSMMCAFTTTLSRENRLQHHFQKVSDSVNQKNEERMIKHERSKTC
jgi:hypothetical protein